MANKKEIKQLGGMITKFHVEDRPEGQFGIVSGYAATWDLDRGDFFGTKDKFIKGAFLDSIADHIQRKRDVRFLSNHDKIIGKFAIQTVHEDEKGLFASGEINLEVQEGREIYSLVKQKAISDFSIGFTVDEFTVDGEIRSIIKATMWEFSLVKEPMNPLASVTDIKSIVAFQDLQLADRDRVWDATKAIENIKSLTKSEEEPSDSYKNAFLWYDRENSDKFSAYKLPIADVIDMKLRAIPRGIFAAAAALLGARGGVDIPENDRPGVIRNIERYYAKMDLPSPFSEQDKQYFTYKDIEKMDTRSLEKAFRKTGCFSQSVSKMMACKILPGSKIDETQKINNNKSLNDVIDVIMNLKKIIASE